jgi:hypothetical protein
MSKVKGHFIAFAFEKGKIRIFGKNGRVFLRNESGVLSTVFSSITNARSPFQKN